ncbi:MAG: hypothetical protein HOI47_20890 [Candidatus Scalindua sp.]|jgi:hypothetical protein|nr:hypothetical protein [Candidatus Scalindua sp.]MBT6229105.1 hypothetical protein [Candidatus Scalindua sp.]
MKLKQHIIYGGVASLCLFPKFGFLSGVFWAASVLIDVDHYIDYIYQNRFSCLSIKKMFIYCDMIFDWKDRQGFLGLSIFHTIEVVIGVYLISAWMSSDVIKAIFWGMVFHMILDIIYLLKIKSLFARAFSLIEYVIRKQLIIRNGFLPNKMHEKILIAVNNRSQISKILKE